MRISEGSGRKVVSTASAGKVGKVGGYVFDARAGRVVALILKKTGTRATILPWEHIQGFGADAVTVSDAANIIEADDAINELLAKRMDLVRKRVLTTAGVQIGQVADVDIDTSDGRITALVLADGEIEGGRLLGAGPYAVVVRA